MGKGWHCPYCQQSNCYGECENYLIDIIEHTKNRSILEKIFSEIPKFNYVLNSKIASIFGTEIEVAKDSNRNDEKTKEFKKFLYQNNNNGQTNLSEIKRAIREKEIFGKSYLFIMRDGKKIALYFIPVHKISITKNKKDDPLMDNILYYSLGEIKPNEIPERLTFNRNGYIKTENGYIISKRNMIVFESDSYVLNSDLMQLQNLIQINRKINESTTYRDYGNIFVFPKGKVKDMLSATGNRMKEEFNKAIKKMRDKVASLIKKNNTDDSNVIMLDEQYDKVQQVQPLTKITDYQFYWDKQDDILSSVVNFPTILLNLGEASGNISKEALIKDARTNFLTPLKNETANDMSLICDKLFTEQGYYLRFLDYEETEL